MQRNAAELTRRRHGLAVVRVVTAWRRPLLAISGLRGRGCDRAFHAQRLALDLDAGAIG